MRRHLGSNDVGECDFEHKAHFLHVAVDELTMEALRLKHSLHSTSTRPRFGVLMKGGHLKTSDYCSFYFIFFVPVHFPSPGTGPT